MLNQKSDIDINSNFKLGGKHSPSINSSAERLLERDHTIYELESSMSDSSFPEESDKEFNIKPSAVS